MRTLRGRLILSHILPLLLVVPLVGAALVYILETQVALSRMSDDMVRQGERTAEMAEARPILWTDSGEAQQFVTLYSVQSRSRVMLLDAKGNLVASSEPRYAAQIGQPMTLPYLRSALAGEREVHISYTTNLEAEIVQVFVPVLGSDQEILGVVHLSQHLSDLSSQFGQLRTLILAALAAELLLGVIIGLALALNLGRSLRGVTDAIHEVATGHRWEILPERDPEEIRKLLQAFNMLIERLRLLEESRRRLLANLVHELGRPMGALQSGLTALLSGADEDPELRRELMEGMDGQLQRMRPLLDSLTDLHDQVLGTLELDLQPIALSEWLPRTVTPWRQAAHDKGLHWEITVPVSLPVVEIDPDRLAQVLGNLLSNAIKYTAEGLVSVEAERRDKGVVITVADTGIGISPLEQDYIFEPFYRSQRDRRFPQGMGLGLSIARDLVVAHGGELAVDSAPGQGSRFTIWLPQAAAQGFAAET